MASLVTTTINGTLTGNSSATFDSSIRTKSQLRVSNDYSINYFYKTNNTTMLGYLLMRDDNNSFLSFPAAQDFRFLHGNTSRIAVKTDGNVGIGAATIPEATLHIKEIDTDEDAILKISPNNGSYDPVLQFTPQDGTLDNEGFEIWYDNNVGDAHIHTIYNNDAAAIRFHTRTGASKSTSNERFTIAGDGNVGIGTAVPSQKLHVQGNLRVTGAYYASDNNAGSSNQVLTSTGSGGTDWKSLSQIGGVTGSGTSNKLPLWDGTSSLTDSIITQSSTSYVTVFGGFRVSGNHTDTGSQLNLWCDSSGHGKLAVYDMQFLTGSNLARNNTALFLKNDGNVGIGTASPASKLHVHSTTGILHTGDNFYSWVLKYLSNQGSGSAVINYYLIAAKTQTNVRFDGVLKGARQVSTSATGSGGARITFYTNNAGTPLATGGLESWATDSYGHPIFKLVELTYNSVEYYAIEISPSTSWSAGFAHVQFEGYANNVLFTNLGTASVSGVAEFSGEESVFSYKYGKLGIGTGSPDAKLHIKAPASSVPAEIRLEHNDGGTQTAKIVFDQSGQNKLVLSTQYQSSSDGNLIQFSPADNIAMTIRGGTGTSDGFVGIGTVSPDSGLTIAKAQTSAHTYTTNHLHLATPTTSNNGGATTISFATSTSDNYGWSLSAIRETTNGNNTRFAFKSHNNSDSGSEVLSVLAEGSVGIGSTDPDSSLVVYKSEADSIIHVRGVSNGADARVRINGYNSSELYIDRNGVGRFAFRRTTGTDDLSLLKLNDDYTDNSTIMFWDYSSGNVGIGATTPTGKLQIGDNYTINASYGGDDIYIKGTTNKASYDPNVYNTDDIGALITISDSDTVGPTKPGLVLYNDDVTAGGFSPMLLFSKRETGSSPFKATMAGIYARSPLGTGDSNGWIDGELIFATAGAASHGIKQRMVINKEGLVGIGTTIPGYRLDVVEIGGVASSRIRSTNANVARLFLSNTVGTWRLYSAAASNSFRIFSDSLNDDAFVIDSSGNVTIGNGGNGGGATITPGGQTSVYALKVDRSGSSGTSVDIWDNNSNSVVIGATSSEQTLTVKAGGNVGIGIPDPKGDLHVSTTGNYTEVIISSVVNATSGSYLRLTEGANDWGSYGYLGGYIQYNGNDNLIIIGRHNTNGTTLTDDIPAITIKRDNGRVGVGTTNPSNPLHVVSGDNVLATFESTNANATLYLKDSNTTLSSTFKRITNDLAILESGGNVGINTTAPTSKLQIIGSTSGDSVLKVDGTNGTLFEVVDDLSDSLMSVNDAAGLPVFEVFADNTIIGGRYNKNDFYLQGSSGKIGMGTGSPDATGLTIQDTAGDVNSGVRGVFALKNYAGVVTHRFSSSYITGFASQAYATYWLFNPVNSNIAFYVRADNSLGPRLQLNNSSGSSSVYLSTYAGIPTAFNVGQENIDFNVRGDSDINLFYADASTDRIGIGTNAPAQLLHVHGVTQLGAAGKTEGGAVLNYASFGETKSSASTILGNAIVPGTANSTVQRSKSDAGNFVRLKYNTGICFHTNVTSTINTDIAETTNERVRINLTGSLLISDGLVGTPSLSFINDTNTGMWRPGSDQLRLVTGGSDAIVINSSQAIQLPDYGSGNNTGTRAYFLAVDSAGNIIEDSGGGGGTIGDGTITLAAGTGLTGGGSFSTNQSANATITFNATGSGSGTVSEVTVNTGLSVTNGTTTPDISLVLTDLPDMTQNWDTNNDEFIVLDNGTDQKRKLSSEIFGANAFNSTTIPTNNTQLLNGAGYTTNTGTVTGTGTDGTIAQWSSASGIEDSIIVQNSDGNIGISTTPAGASQKLHINGGLRVVDGFYDSSGDVGSNGQILSSTGSGTAWITGGGGTGTVTGTGTAGYISKWDTATAIENSNVFQGANGNVGIGTIANLSQKLHVQGDLRVTGGIYDTSGDVGSDGQILSSTGSGTNWTDAGTGTVTSVSTGGTVNGLTLTGGPIIGSGTITLGGTLGSIANSALTNSSITINGTSTALGGSIDAIPTGGTTGQALTKSSNVNYAVTWTNVMTHWDLQVDGTSNSEIDDNTLVNFAAGTGMSISKGTTAGGFTLTFASSTSSDYRLKKNISTFNSEAWTKIKNVNLRKFDFDEDAVEVAISSPDTEINNRPDQYKDNLGFIAHELAEAGIDGAVIGDKDAVDENGNFIYQKVNYLALVPVLWGALNEAIFKIETLETKVRELQNK